MYSILFNSGARYISNRNSGEDQTQTYPKTDILKKLKLVFFGQEDLVFY